MLQLPLDVAQKRGGAEAEQVRLQPAVAEFVLHHREVNERVLGLGDAAGGFVADLDAGAGFILADRPDHCQRHRQGRVHRFFAGRGLDEIGSGHHADQAGAGDVAQSAKLARREDRFHMRVAAGLAEGAHSS
jgi:hypothetical protein